MKKINYNPSQEDCENAYNKRFKKAQKMVYEPDRLQKLLDGLEKKLAKLPGLGGTLANVPVLVSMVRSYVRGEYKAFPLSVLISAVAALTYFLSPIDMIPDAIPAAGLVDDAGVLAVALKFINDDVEAYKKWRDEHYSAVRITVDE